MFRCVLVTLIWYAPELFSWNSSGYQRRHLAGFCPYISFPVHFRVLGLWGFCLWGGNRWCLNQQCRGAAGQMKVWKRIQGNLDSYAFHCSLALLVGAVDMTLCVTGRKEADAVDCPAPALALGLGWAFSAMVHPGSMCRPSGAPRVSTSVLLGPSPLHKNSSSSQNPVESRQFWLPGHWGLLMPEHHPQAPGGWTQGPRVQLPASSSTSRRLGMGHAELRKSYPSVLSASLSHVEGECSALCPAQG